MLSKGLEASILIGEQMFTGKDCLVSTLTITTDNNIEPCNFFNEKSSLLLNPGIVRISIEMICKNENFISSLLEENYRPKIRNKKVDDCSIQELLFAVREKIKKGKDKKSR